MGGSEPEGVASQFIVDNIALLLSLYSLAYMSNGGSMEYVITDRQHGEDVSFSIMLAHNTFSRKIHVCKFYPGLYRQADSKYLSAASFFLFVHHFGQKFKISDNHSVLPIKALKVFFGLEKLFPHLLRSDHSPFWAAVMPALMWTDTAEFRNPHYHASTDTPDTLDYNFLQKVTILLLESVREQLRD